MVLGENSGEGDIMKRADQESPFFSIIVPAYNNEHELKRCIDSILAQHSADFELIIVNDGSTDATPDICDAYALQDSRIQVVHKENQGVAAARNDGLFRAAGKYVYYADADDWIEQGLLQEAIHVLEQPEPPDLFIFGHKRSLETGKLVHCPWPLAPGSYSRERLEAAVYPRMLQAFGTGREARNLVCPVLWDKIIARDLLLAHYCTDISLFYGEDLVCAYECVRFAKEIYFSGSCYYVYDQYSESSMYRRYHPGLFRNNIAMAAYLRSRENGRNAALARKQVNELAFNGLITAACQEIRFASSLRQAARRWKTILKEEAAFPVSPLEGLSFPARACILLFSFRIVYPAMLMIKLLCGKKGIPVKTSGAGTLPEGK